MPWTNAATIAFFTANDQMAIPTRTCEQLVTEGITLVDDLAEFEDSDFKEVAYNLSHPPVIPNEALPPVLVPQQPFILGAKSLHRLKVAAKAVRYCHAVGRSTSATNMHYMKTRTNLRESVGY